MKKRHTVVYALIAAAVICEACSAPQALAKLTAMRNNVVAAHKIAFANDQERPSKYVAQLTACMKKTDGYADQALTLSHVIDKPEDACSIDGKSANTQLNPLNPEHVIIAGESSMYANVVVTLGDVFGEGLDITVDPFTGWAQSLEEMSPRNPNRFTAAAATRALGACAHKHRL